MKRFRFPLQRVLDVRSALVRQGRVELRAALGRVRDAERQAAAARDLHARFSARITAAESRGMSATEWLLAREHLGRLGDAIAAAESAVAAAVEGVRDARRRLERRRRDERALERLAERRREAHAAAWVAEEQKALDEAASVRFGRGFGVAR